MTRFVVDADVVFRLASGDQTVSARHELLTPTLLRSQTLSRLHEAVHRGQLADERSWLLGDAVLRRIAAVWEARGVLRQEEGDEAQAHAMFWEAAAAFERAGNQSDADRCLAAADRGACPDRRRRIGFSPSRSQALVRWDCLFSGSRIGRTSPQAEAFDPSVTSSLCAANAPKTSSFSREGTSK
jgi:hypothetical protein